MANFVQSKQTQQQRSLLWVTVFALVGFLSFTYLAFHQPQSLQDKNVVKENIGSQNMTQAMSQSMPSHHYHHDEQQAKNPADNQTSKNQNSRLVDALLVMGGLGCH